MKKNVLMGLGGKIENLYLPKYAETRERDW
jgi:hypothetical protein